MSLPKTLALLALVSGTILLVVPASLAQSSFANLTGTITDASGAVVPGVTVSIQNADTKVARQIKTNASGYFSATNLPAGTYNITAEAQGFEKWHATGIVLQGSDNKTINIPMKIGTANEIVEVNASSGELVITDSGEKSTSISQKELQELSLQGRNATEFLKILAGASLATNGGLNKPAYSSVVGINGFCAGNGCNAGGLSDVVINGQGGSQQGISGLGISQDGQDTQDPGAPGSATPINPNPDMISEVKVLTSNFSAENDKGPVVVNTVTKSGGSTFHGDLRFNVRNSALNANDAFNKEATVNTPRPDESFYYPGFSLGGPVLIPGTGFNKSRQKVFFFDGYENYRQKLDGGVDRAFIPTPAMLNGDFTGADQMFPGTNAPRPRLYTLPTTPDNTWLGMSEGTRPNCVITNGVMNSACIDPNAQLILKNATPSTGLVDPLTHAGFNYVQSFVAPDNSWQNTVRGDVNFTANTKVYVSWSRQRETSTMPTGLWVGASDWAVPTPTDVIGANGSDFVNATLFHMFSPTLTEESRFGYTWINFPNSLTDPKRVLRKDLGYPLTGVYNNPAVPALTSWGDSMPTFGPIGTDFRPNMIAVKASPSFSQNLTKVIKSHTMKFGYFFEHTYNKQDNWDQYMGIFQYASWAGSPTGNEYADWLMGMGWGAYGEKFQPPAVNIAQNVHSFYAQDDWKLTRRITVNYGMRFDHYARPYDASGLGMATFSPSLYASALAADPNAVNPGVQWHAMNHSIPLTGGTVRPLFYSPRIGAAIDVLGNGKTVIRGGWGKYRAYSSVQSRAYTDPAGTSLGSVSFGCGSNDPACPTIEDLDSHLTTVTLGHPILNGNSFAATPSTNDEQPLVTSYSLTIDQKLPNKFGLEVSYVGNHTDFLQSQVNTNAVPVGAMSDQATIQAQHPAECGSSVTDTSCENLFRPFPAYSQVNESVTAGKAQYDSLQATLRRNVGWLTLQTNYTFSKAVGDGSQVANNGLIASLPDYGAHLMYGILPYDRAHVFSAAYVFHLPNTHMSGKFVKGLANGWQISGITQVETGAQLSAVQGGQFLNFNISQPLSPIDAVGTPDVPALFPLITCNPTQGLHSHQYANPNCFAPTPAGSFGSPSLPYMPGPMYWNTDLTLFKNVKITERQNLELRFAAFNPLNHSLPSFQTADNNLHLIFDGSSNLTTNASGSSKPCPGPECGNFGYADHSFGHRVLEFGAKYSF
jgi:hypothetical protein